MQLTDLIKYANRRVQTSVREQIYLSSNVDLTNPYWVMGIITERCNYRCEYCFHWRLEKYAEEMSFEEWKRALLSLKELVNPYAIQFSGGEPFIVPYFLDLLQWCNDNDIDWAVNTNGSALNQKAAERIARAPPIVFDVSVDSATSDIHDRARGIKGSFSHISAGIRMLVEERNKSGRQFPIRIKSVVHRHNLRSLCQLVDWTLEIGATSVTFAPVSLLPSKERDRLYPNTEEEFEVLATSIEELILRKRQGQPIENSEEQLRGMVPHLKGEIAHNGSGQCRAGLRNYEIRANGDVRVCPCFDPIGNVRTNTAREIWTSVRAREVRSKTVQNTNCPGSCYAPKSFREEVARAFLLFLQITKRA
jgi:MoaA/NifB/PqqE/SkfB family radical SAM enzyme